MIRQRFINLGAAIAIIQLIAIQTNAAVTPSLLSLEEFPSNADFQTFDPLATPATAERTVREDPVVTDGTRHITQTFQLENPLNVQVIDILFARGVSGNTGILRLFDVADTTVADITNDYNNAVTNGFLKDLQFTMPPGLDPLDNTQRTLRLTLSGTDQFTLPGKTAPAGYAFSLSSVVDDNTAVNNEVFTWRFGDPGTGGGVGLYANGRVFYDDFVSSGNTETRRDGLFALSDNVNPTPVAGDYNQNGTVDAADYVAWRENIGAATLPNRDVNITGPVGDNDYNFWRSRLGATSGSGASLAGGLAVPEPGALTLALICAVILMACQALLRSRQ
jgi:hypothetical protein